ncbi:MAG: hypothetical protein KF799_02625 [Bdellovibrionales bacterium]|nr:hypothetical protein [Bdellovibrionales bacterium]
MSFPTFILFLNISIFMVSILLLTKIFPFRKRAEVKWLMVMTLSLSLISFCSLNVYIQESLIAKTIYSRARFIGLAVLGQSWFFFLILTYSRYRLFARRWVIAVCLLPAVVTIGLVLNPQWSPWLTHSYEIVRWQGALLVSFANGPWFPVHIVSANIFAFAALGFMLITIFRSSGVKRKQLIVLFLGSSLSLFIDGYSVATNSSLRWAMFSNATFLVTEVAIFYAIQKHGLLDLAPMAKNMIFHKMLDPVIILDDQHRVLDFNKAAGLAFGISEEDLSQPWRRITEFQDISVSGSLWDWNYCSPTGERRSYQIHVVDLDPRRMAAGRVMFFRDVTDQKEVEQRLNSDLDFKARLLSVIAHDFSAIIQTQSSLSSHLHNEVHEELRPHVGALTSISFASQDLMTNILRWARAQERKLVPLWRPFEINTLIKEVVNNLEAALALKGLKINFFSENYPLIIDGDSVMIESVLRNLLTNSMRASLSGTIINVSLTKDESRVRVTVEDRGVGMNSRQLAVLLGESEMASSQHSSGGFGIGLMIARKFVGLHGGLLQFASEEGKGTLVTLTLPLQKPSG